MKRSTFPIAAVFLSVTVFSAQAALANSTILSHTIQELTEQADLVFQGEVSGIEYRNSSSTDGSSPSPHTFVTYKVSEVISGNYAEPTVTLRFEGGLNPAAGLLTIGSHMPSFDVGDNDILFVKDNGNSYCPLVDCIAGRMRVMNSDELQDEEGYEIVASDKAGKLGQGKRNPSKVVDENKVGGNVIKRHYSTDLSIDFSKKNSPKISSKDLKAKAKTYKSKNGKKVLSQDFQKPFSVNIVSSTLAAGATKEPYDPIMTAPIMTTDSMISAEELGKIQLQEVANHINKSTDDFEVLVPGLDAP